MSDIEYVGLAYGITIVMLSAWMLLIARKVSRAEKRAR